MRGKSEERQSWHLFSCLLGMGRVTWATAVLLPRKERQERGGREEGRETEDSSQTEGGC